MNDFDFDSTRRTFNSEVEREAARLVREGLAAPFDAIELAREIVLRRRRAAAGHDFGDRHHAIKT